jgi:hypothetical protein
MTAKRIFRREVELMRFERGERFFAEGRPWAVLEYAKKRLLAVCPSSGAVREFPISKRLRKTGKVHSALIRTVDHYLETLNVGGKVHLESGPTEIVLKCSNGDLWVADGNGKRLKIPKWKIEGFIAKSLIKRSFESGRSKRNPSSNRDAKSQSPVNVTF